MTVKDVLNIIGYLSKGVSIRIWYNLDLLYKGSVDHIPGNIMGMRVSKFITDHKTRSFIEINVF